jgi:hypothetical protein
MYNISIKNGHAVAKWEKHNATNRKVAGSRPDRDLNVINLPNHSGRTRHCGLLNLQPISVPETEMNNDSGE